MKKGQLSIFILLGLVVIIASAFLLFVQQPFMQPQLQGEAALPGIQQLYSSCAGQVVTEAVHDQLSGGGVLRHDDVIVTPLALVEVGADWKGARVPTLAAMEEELVDVVPLLLIECERVSREAAERAGLSLVMDLASVNATYTSSSLVATIALDAQLFGEEISGSLQPFTMTVATDALALRDKAQGLAEDAVASDGVPMRAALDAVQDVLVVQVSPGSMVLALAGENETFNVGLRMRGAETTSSGPSLLDETLEVSAESVGEKKLNVINPDGLKLTGNVDLPWLDVQETTLYYDTADVAPGDYVASVALQDTLGRATSRVLKVIVR